MSIENDEKRNLSLSDLPHHHPANAGAIDGANGVTSMPPMDWGEPPPLDPIAMAKSKADWEMAKERAVQADPRTLGPADRLARHYGLKDQRTAAKEATQERTVEPVVDMADTGQASDATAPAPKVRKARTSKAKDQVQDVSDGAQQTDAVAKPSRKSRVAVKAPDLETQSQPGNTEAVKSTRPRRKAAAKAAAELGQPGAVAALSVGGDDIPPITPEAIGFLGNPDAKATDLFKLSPESRAFVQYHITHQQHVEADLALGWKHLDSISPKFSPAFEKVADALMEKLKRDRLAGVPVPDSFKGQRVGVDVQEPKSTTSAAEPTPGVSYRSRNAQMGTYQAIPVQLGKMDVKLDKEATQEQGAGLANADISRADQVIGTAHAMMSARIGEVTREQVADLITGDLAEVRAIKDERARKLALDAMVASSHAQPYYKGAFKRLAPELVVPANEAHAAMEAERSAKAAAVRLAVKASEANAENTVERGLAPERESQQADAAQESTSSVDPGVRLSGLGLGKRMLRAVGSWLQSKAEERPAPAPDAKPVSLDKPAAPAIPGDDRTNLVPEAVTRRFLKVEQDYYFPDRTLAFSDRGNKLATRGAHPEVVRSLIEIAQARGWDSITAKGDDSFRRSIWMEGSQAGLKVAGYKPTALDLAELASKPARNTVEKGAVKERDVSTTQQPTAQATKADAAAQAPQEKADQAAGAAPDPELAAKARSFENDKPGFVIKKYPELAQAYGVVDAAKKFAEANLPEDVRDEFVSLARRHVMQKIVDGEQVKGPKVYMAPPKTKDVVDQSQVPAKDAADLGKAPRAKEVAPER